MNLLAKRLPTILGMLLLLGIAGGLWWYMTNNKPVVVEEMRPQKVRITNVADNKFAVSWITKAATTGQIEYGKVGEKIGIKVSDERDTGEAGVYRTHQVTVAGLQPSTQYAFRVISEEGAKFDNSGSPYSVTTGKVIGTTPPAESFYGEVKQANEQPLEGALVYVALPGAGAVSTLTKSSGSYSLPLSTIRTGGGDEYVTYDPATTIATVSVEDGRETASATVPMTAANPVPTITMGKQLDFRTETISEPEVAQVEPETPTIFNVEPLGNTPSETGELVLLNPAKEGEQVATTLPEFRGLAPGAAILAITLHSTVPYNDTIEVAADGTWEWTPPSALSAGEHTITIAYVDEAGFEKVLERSFFVSTVLAAEGEPAFEATPAATVYPSPSPSEEASASPRVSTPSTESGVPVSGVMSYTLLTGAVGIVIMVLGALLLAF